MRRAALFSIAAAVGLAACNGPAQSPATPNVLPQRATGVPGHAPDDFSVNDLHAGGATSGAVAFNGGTQPVGLAVGNGGAGNPQAPPAAGTLFGTIKEPFGGTIYYCLTSSGSGRAVFEGGPGAASAPAIGPCAPLGAKATGYGARVDPLDFAASDVALASTDYTTYKTYREPSTGTNWGEPVELPSFAGEIVFGYRPQDFSKTYNSRIHLSTWTMCAIANGTVSDWNDAAITKDNGASITHGVSQPILFYFRSDNAATSYTLTYHLNAVCNRTWRSPYNKPPYTYAGHGAQWVYGYNSVWPGPGSAAAPNARFVGVIGNPGVIAAIESTPFALGYAEGAWAKAANPPVAEAFVQSGYHRTTGPVWSDPLSVASTSASLGVVTNKSLTYGGGSDGLPLTTTRPECVLYVDPSRFTNPEALGAPDGAYPIVQIGYLLFYGNNNGVHTQAKRHLLYYLSTQRAHNIETQFGYTPLSPSLQGAVNAAVRGGNGHSPCVQ
ncbi:MAG: substrate-binding domain-containing protein [Candidatus Eremiobacteraeota bacterium]|nr:substrate-binding domain-containing protein [Candidatus Eremiobacteraeota bacterium]